MKFWLEKHELNYADVLAYNAQPNMPNFYAIYLREKNAQNIVLWKKITQFVKFSYESHLKRVSY